MQMIRMGDMVGLRYDIKSANDDFGIFNVIKDTHEASNLAASMPQLQKQMKEKVLQVRRVNTSAVRPYDNALISATAINSTINGVTWKAYNGNFSWIPDVSELPIVASGKCGKPDLSEIKNTGHQTYLFEGYIKVPEDGDYTFYLSAAGKAFLRIHEASIIDADYGYKAGDVKESTIKLKAGLHPFKIYYSGKSNSSNAIDFEWKGPSFAKTAVAANTFYQ
jgi:hypothetical protein